MHDSVSLLSLLLQPLLTHSLCPHHPSPAGGEDGEQATFGATLEPEEIEEQSDDERDALPLAMEEADAGDDAGEDMSQEQEKKKGGASRRRRRPQKSDPGSTNGAKRSRGRPSVDIYGTGEGAPSPKK